jgi:hypothetical protein
MEAVISNHGMGLDYVQKSLKLSNMKEGRNSNFHMNDSFEQYASTCPPRTYPSLVKINTFEHTDLDFETEPRVSPKEREFNGAVSIAEAIQCRLWQDDNREDEITALPSIIQTPQINGFWLLVKCRMRESNGPKERQKQLKKGKERVEELWLETVLLNWLSTSQNGNWNAINVKVTCVLTKRENYFSELRRPFTYSY